MIKAMWKDCSRREFLKAAALGTVAAALEKRVSGKENKVAKPNVVVILVDDLGYGDLGCFGADDLRTPHVDSIAADGIRFSRFYSNCPVCSPTRASLLTGRYPDLVGVPGVIRTHRENSWGFLSQEAILLPQAIKAGGYHTALVGKWHLGLESPNTPTERGFDTFHGFLGDMMDDYYTHKRHDINYMRKQEEEIHPEGHATDLFTQWAVDYIGERARKEEPFFLYLAYNAPHTPIQPPEEWLERVKERDPRMDQNRAKLAALIEHMDNGVGRVKAALNERGILENTLLLFVSDNGGQLNIGASNGELKRGKGDMFEGGIKVPMCAQWPGKIPPGSQSERVALTMDLFATVCEACGVDPPEKIEGRSILATLQGAKQPEENRTLFWVRREGNHYGGRAYYAARHENWKLLQNSPFEPLELYDLASDPHEDNPLPKNHDMHRKLFDDLRNHVNDSGMVPWQRPD